MYIPVTVIDEGHAKTPHMDVSIPIKVTIRPIPAYRRSTQYKFCGLWREGRNEK